MTGLEQRSTMEPVLITDPGGIAEIEDEWRNLAELRSNAFVTPEWFRSWWAHQGGASTPLIVAVHRADGTLAGVMPMALDASSRPHAIRFAGATLGDRFHPAACEEDESAVAVNAMAALERAGLGGNMLLLERIDPTRAWWAEMPRSSSLRLAAIERDRTELPYAVLKGVDWQSYLAQRSANFRAQVRRRERVLERDHALEVRGATVQTLEADLAELFRLHALRWQGRRSVLEDSSAKQVLAAFATAAQRQGWLRMHFLEADGAPVAAFLDWRLGRAYFSYQGGFDPAWAKNSVGIVLTAITIRMAIEEGAEEFDFLLGDEPYKRRFTAARRNRRPDPGLAPDAVAGLR